MARSRVIANVSNFRATGREKHAPKQLNQHGQPLQICLEKDRPSPATRETKPRLAGTITTKPVTSNGQQLPCDSKSNVQLNRPVQANLNAVHSDTIAQIY